jgi:hypothetical protein
MDDFCPGVTLKTPDIRRLLPTIRREPTMGTGEFCGGGLVLMTRRGEKWQAEIFIRREGGGARRAAEVTGSLGCVELIAREGAALLTQDGGEELFLDFLRANRCRVIGPASTVAHGELAANQPSNANA